MFGRKKPEVLVIGAGPVGLFVALSLTNRGVRVQIVDREWRHGGRSYALALHPASLGLLEGVGALSPVLERAYRVRTVGLYDGAERRAQMCISELPGDHSFLAVLRQEDLETVLEDALAKAGVKVTWNHDARQLAHRDDEVAVTLDKLTQATMGYAVQHTEWVVSKQKEIRAPIVVGADGSRSLVRRELGIDFPTVAEPQVFAVFEFKTDADLGDEMRLVVDEQTTNVCWPLPGGYCRWSFEIPDFGVSPDSRVKDHDILQLGAEGHSGVSAERLQVLLSERAPWFSGKVDGIRWRMLVKFERRLADSFGNGRAWLAGDAGHLTGPAGVQSMNVGLREADDLAAVIARILKDGAPLTDLASYGEARRIEWERLLGMRDWLRASPDTDPWIGERYKALIPCIPAAGNELSLLVRQLGLTE